MNQKEIIKGSIRILRRNKMRTFFMIIGTIIGITALTVTFTIGKGSQKLITERAKKYLGTNNLLVIAQRVELNDRPNTSDLISTLTLADAQALQKEVPNINMVDPVHILPNQEIVGNGSNIQTTVKGTSAIGKIVWNRNVIKGEYFSEADVLGSSRVALIGTKIAENLFKDSNPIGAQIRIGNAPFIVKGVLEPKGVDPHGVDMDLDVVVPVTTLMRRLTNVDYISMIKVVLEDESKLDATVAALSSVLKERHQLSGESKADFNIITPAFVKQKIEEMTRVFNVFLPLISLIALLASGIVIVVLMLISTNERVSEIGLRVAVGARTRDIQRQFIIETSITSILGGVIGILLGLVGFILAAGIMELPLFIPWQILLLGTLLPMLVGVLAGIIPARKAAKLNPVEALR